jgi:hypothetical protein
MSDAFPRNAGGDVKKEPLDKEAQHTLEEARTVVPGIQAIRLSAHCRLPSDRGSDYCSQSGRFHCRLFPIGSIC